MIDINKMAAKLIKENKFLTLATRNKKGDVWATPLSYSFDKECNFYFTTAIDSIHVDHIKENPYVSFTIFNSTLRVSDIDGLQIKGIVGEVDRKDLPTIVKAYYLHVFPDSEERAEWESPAENFTKDDFPAYRFFQIVPLEIYKRDTENLDVDRRVEISKSEIIKYL